MQRFKGCKVKVPYRLDMGTKEREKREAITKVLLLPSGG